MVKIGQKINPKNKEYVDIAIWCNTNNAVIVKQGDEYVIEAVPEKTTEELKAEVRAVRNQYLEQTDKFLIADYPITAEEREQYKAYRSYLRDYTKAEEWYKDNPLTFDEWLFINK